ncbi:hypothetical protein Pelo_10765 [Pelomyxa schiedti]|nr:hypothetical protein Pelo_10765 [Pelomyxa schiedti]
MDEVRQWLTDIGCQGCIGMFEAELVDSMSTVALLTQDDLVRMGLKTGQLVRIRAAIHLLPCFSSAPTPAPAPGDGDTDTTPRCWATCPPPGAPPLQAYTKPCPKVESTPLRGQQQSGGRAGSQAAAAGRRQECDCCGAKAATPAFGTHECAPNYGCGCGRMAWTKRDPAVVVVDLTEESVSPTTLAEEQCGVATTTTATTTSSSSSSRIGSSGIDGDSVGDVDGGVDAISGSPSWMSSFSPISQSPRKKCRTVVQPQPNQMRCQPPLLPSGLGVSAQLQNSFSLSEIPLGSHVNNSDGDLPQEGLNVLSKSLAETTVIQGQEKLVAIDNAICQGEKVKKIPKSLWKPTCKVSSRDPARVLFKPAEYKLFPIVPCNTTEQERNVDINSTGKPAGQEEDKEKKEEDVRQEESKNEEAYEDAEGNGEDEDQGDAAEEEEDNDVEGEDDEDYYKDDDEDKVKDDNEKNEDEDDDDEDGSDEDDSDEDNNDEDDSDYYSDNSGSDDDEDDGDEGSESEEDIKLPKKRQSVRPAWFSPTAIIRTGMEVVSQKEDMCIFRDFSDVREPEPLHFSDEFVRTVHFHFPGNWFRRLYAYRLGFGVPYLDAGCHGLSTFANVLLQSIPAYTANLRILSALYKDRKKLRQEHALIHFADVTGLESDHDINVANRGKLRKIVVHETNISLSIDSIFYKHFEGYANQVARGKSNVPPVVKNSFYVFFNQKKEENGNRG